MASPNQGTPTSGSSKLDNASKEDLVKLLKRQQVLSKKNNTEKVQENERLKEGIATLQCELQSYESTVERLKKENDDIYTSNQLMTSNIEELSCAMKKKESERKKLSNEREDHLSELAVLRDNKTQMKGILGSLQESEAALQQDITTLTAKLDSEQQKGREERKERGEERAAWKEQIALVETQLQESNKKLQEAEHSATLKQELFQAKSDIVSLKNEGDALKSLIRDYNDQFTQEAQTIAQVLGALEHATALRDQEELEKELAERNAYISKMEHEAIAAENEIAKLEKQLAQRNIMVACEERNETRVEPRDDALGTAGDDDVVRKENAELKERLLKLERGLEELEEEKKVWAEKMGDLQEEKRKMSLHLDEFLSENATFKDQQDTEDELESQFLLMKSTVGEKERDIEELNTQLYAINNQLQDLQQEYSELLERNEELRSNVNFKQEALDMMGQEKVNIEEESKALLTRKEESEELLGKKEEELVQLREDLACREEDLTEVETERDSLISQVFLLEEQVTQLTSDLESERARTETLEHSSRATGRMLVEREAEVESLTQELKDARELNDRLKEDTQGSHHLMDMELADYQRAADTLQEKLNASKLEVKQVESELLKKEGLLDKSHSEVKELEKQRSNLDEMITKLKALLMKSKKEAADSKREEDDSRQICAETKRNLEQSTQQCEEYKLELSQVRGQLNCLEESSRRNVEEKGAMVKRLETRLLALQEDMEKERALKVEVSAQFESYKVRVHSVLKQQKCNDTVIGISEHEAIVIQLSKELELLKCQVHELRQSRDCSSSQRDELEQELEQVLANLERLERDSTEREKFYLERVGELEETVRHKEQQIYKSIQSSASQRTALTDSYTKTMEQANTTHQEESQILQDRISRLEAELSSTTALKSLEPSETSTPIRPPPRVRLGAEGMESPGPTSTMSLEDILSSSKLSRSSSRVSITSAEVPKEDGKISHLSTLLSESEHNAAALQEQCAVLKGEVRRLETMLGRDNTNIEYLKNVVMKYLSSEAAAREQLVPVLCTVLNLTREERDELRSCSAEGKREQVPWSSSWFSSNS